MAPHTLVSWLATERYWRARRGGENALYKRVLRRENPAEGTSFEKMCSCEARNGNSESVVLFGTGWQVTEEQMHKGAEALV